MGTSPASAPAAQGRWLVGCGSVAVALASSLLLPMAATAVPIQTAGTPSTSAAAPAVTATMTGPRRPGAVPSTSTSRVSATSSDLSSGPRRPVPGKSETLTAEK
jgi:hypothetical protein